MPQQIPLSFWSDHANFENFYPADNAQILAALKALVRGQGERYIYLHGPPGVGLSHLLFAACHGVNQQTGATMYLPLGHDGVSPQMLDGMEQLQLCCWDDLDNIAGNLAWEEALFHGYNRAQVSGTRLLVAARQPPAQIAWKLPDLASRLLAGPVFALQPLSDAQKVRALQLRAKQRGLDFSEEVGSYLLSRCPRDMASLMALLDKLDHTSLVEQRRLTVPLVREVLGN